MHKLFESGSDRENLKRLKGIIKMKKIIGLMFGVMLSQNVMADQCVVNGYTWTYEVIDGKARITNVSPRNGIDLIFPDVVGGYEVFSIDGEWDGDSRYTSFTGSLVLPKGLESIGRWAFSRCKFSGKLDLPNSVISIGDGAFSYCDGFSGELRLPKNLRQLGGCAFKNCTGFSSQEIRLPKSLTFIGSMHDGDGAHSNASPFNGMHEIKKIIFEGDPLCVKANYESIFCVHDCFIVYDRKYRSELLRKHGSIIEKQIGSDGPVVYIVSSKIRETDPTVMDVVYKVTSSQPTVKVRALAFEDGIRSFENVVRPETFIEGTEANIGDGIAANVEHKLSWKVSSDWQETLAKVKFEILALDGGLLPLELTILPKTETQPKMEVSWNDVWDSWILDAMLWLYADKDSGLSLTAGVLKKGDISLIKGNSFVSDSVFYNKNSRYMVLTYIYGKMGYELLQGERLEYVRQMLRRKLPDVKGGGQYAVKVIEE